METLRSEGKLLFYGVSNYSAENLAEAVAAGRPVVNQLPYNLLEREIEEETLPFCQSNEVGIFAYGAICRGLLTGKFRKGTTFPASDLRHSDPKFQEPRFSGYLNVLDRLRPIAYARNKNLAQLAICWIWISRGSPQPSGAQGHRRRSRKQLGPWVGAFPLESWRGSIGSSGKRSRSPSARRSWSHPAEAAERAARCRAGERRAAIRRRAAGGNPPTSDWR